MHASQRRQQAESCTRWFRAAIIWGIVAAAHSGIRSGHSIRANKRALLAAFLAYQCERALLLTICMQPPSMLMSCRLRVGGARGGGGITLHPVQIVFACKRCHQKSSSCSNTVSAVDASVGRHLDAAQTRSDAILLLHKTPVAGRTGGTWRWRWRATIVFSRGLAGNVLLHQRAIRARSARHAAFNIPLYALHSLQCERARTLSLG